MEGDGDYFVKVTEADEAKFVRNTPASLAHMADDLAAKHNVVTRAAFSALEMCYGLKYDPSAIIFNRSVRDMAALPYRLYWDWMHCLVASGGVAQYQCNSLLANLKSNGISLKDLDDFARQVTMPKTWERLKKPLFQDRLVNGADEHIKAFTSEMMSVIAILGIFLDAVIRPLGILREHVSCFDNLRSILNCLRLGDEVLPLVPRVKELLRRHNEAFAVLYPDSCKQQLHFLGPGPTPAFART